MTAPSKKPTHCTRKCWNALHEKCTCGCGGKNHGMKLAQLDLFGEQKMRDMQANYVIVEETPEMILIRDLGPWDKYMTVTNAAETVVEELVGHLNGRRLEYFDS